MASITNTVLIDSLDETVTENVETFTFFHPVTGVKLEIELGTANAEAFFTLVDSFVVFADAAEVVVPPKQVRKTAKATTDKNNEVRIWARANGFTIGDRGRIKAEILEAYEASLTVVAEDAPEQVDVQADSE